MIHTLCCDICPSDLCKMFGTQLCSQHHHGQVWPQSSPLIFYYSLMIRNFNKFYFSINYYQYLYCWLWKKTLKFIFLTWLFGGLIIYIEYLILLTWLLFASQETLERLGHMVMVESGVWKPVSLKLNLVFSLYIHMYQASISDDKMICNTTINLDYQC